MNEQLGFEHLAGRRAEGHGVIERWKQHKATSAT